MALKVAIKTVEDTALGVKSEAVCVYMDGYWVELMFDWGFKDNGDGVAFTGPRGFGFLYPESKPCKKALKLQRVLLKRKQLT